MTETSLKRPKQSKRADSMGYQSIASVLEDWLRHGRYKAGDQFPTEMELAREFDVSRVTIRRALALLTANGLLIRTPRKGTFVSVRATVDPLVAAFGSYSQKALRSSRGISNDYLGRVPVDPDEATRLLFKMRKGQRIVVFSFERLMKKDVLAYVTIEMREDAAKQVSDAMMENPAQFAPDVQKVGGDIDRIRQSIGAIAADPALAEKLGINTGLPILRFTRLLLDKKGQVVQRIISHFRADLYEYDIEFV